MTQKIQMVDLAGQYRRYEKEIDAAIKEVLVTSSFINGPQVAAFKDALGQYMGAKHVIPCANGTDALQIALMALGLNPGDEVIVPAFTYVASAEVIALLKFTPVMVDVDYDSFNVRAQDIEPAITPRTKAIIPVHLFGQSCDMDPILDLAGKHNLYVIEDNAQALGSWYTRNDGSRKQAGTMGTIGCTSFFPSKNLGCYGDGGAIFTESDEWAGDLKMIANHGQSVKYHHKVVGCNSRLDTLQAAILSVKLSHLGSDTAHRYQAAQIYTQGLKDCQGLVTPLESSFSTHVYHQYTIKVKEGRRNALKEYLAKEGIPSMIYYPLPLQEQEAFQTITKSVGSLGTAKLLSQEVLSLPIDSEITPATQEYIIDTISGFFRSLRNG